MNDPTLNIGNMLRKIRKEKGLTLEQTANITSVSKAMLGQIERGESVPSISILWKISTGMKISLSELLEDEDEELEVVNIDDTKPINESDNTMQLYDVFSFDSKSGFECFYIKLKAGGHKVSEPHRYQSMEHIIVTNGTLKLKIDEQEFILKAPSAIKFKGDVEHEYINESDEDVIFQNIIKYQ